MSELLNVSKHIAGIYRLVECKDKKMTPDELREIAEMARRAAKIYYRLEQEASDLFVDKRARRMNVYIPTKEH